MQPKGTISKGSQLPDSLDQEQKAAIVRVEEWKPNPILYICRFLASVSSYLSRDNGCYAQSHLLLMAASLCNSMEGCGRQASPFLWNISNCVHSTGVTFVTDSDCSPITLLVNCFSGSPNSRFSCGQSSGCSRQTQICLYLMDVPLARLLSPLMHHFLPHIFWYRMSLCSQNSQIALCFFQLFLL